MEQTIESKKVTIVWETRTHLDGNLHAKAEEIKRLVALEMLSTVEDMEMRGRKREHVTARQLAMSFIRDRTFLPLKVIGGMFGGRDHTTVIHAIQAVEDLKDSDKRFKKQFEYLDSLIEK